MFFRKMRRKIREILHRTDRMEANLESITYQTYYHSNQEKIFSFNHFFDKSPQSRWQRKYQQCGTIKFYLPYALDDWLQSIILRTSDFYDIASLQRVDKYLPSNATICDIGANVGNHSIYWAMVRGAARIYAFEPIKETYDLLCKNIALNGLDNKCNLFHLALGEQQSRGSIKASFNDNIGATQICNDTSGELIIESLDRLENLGTFAHKIDFVKIDVEGFEGEVLSGGGGILCST
ncbi:FkbM family methyltransferase [Helicobacter sp. MIT 21-1697]|uniref:FkbM family methyltransferase n=1 Tax=Helicobacter sp. MIT 21-1697 TaxID=2993733 RepID=UPI00224AD5F0|nr:FkbM family methyltransferase [Helicobacter sp. MIT 21-1697]MCX2716503.1 FkbM family methyltransferase [Helicobacter sp. MIT 21-1697]